MQTVMLAAAAVPVEKHDIFWQRIGAMLMLRGRSHFDDDDVASVTALALNGMTHQPAAHPTETGSIGRALAR